MAVHGHFSSYEGHKERRTGKIRGAFSRMHRALEGWMLARAPASPAQGLHHHGPRYFNIYYFCTMWGLEKLGLLIVDQNWLHIEVVCLLLSGHFERSATNPFRETRLSGSHEDRESIIFPIQLLL